MSLKKTYIDSGVSIAAFQGVHSTSIRVNFQRDRQKSLNSFQIFYLQLIYIGNTE
ncbi:hypothetical protein [Argonema galeatum]|uniref:hypothetical protein n=1 Tax=Argonema galeatum TaxID=2942762 RepID=UPI002012D249|nr:hypothetical protein [Argonema galeatum]MCL1464004.1 hypothetical protein [Argonema galeatum A003/A1]